MKHEHQIVNDLVCHRIMEHEYASKMNLSIQKVCAGKSYSYKRRMTRVLLDFFEYCDKNAFFIKTGSDVSLCYSAWQEALFSNYLEKSPESLKSDAQALHVCLNRLCSNSVYGLPETHNIQSPRKLRPEVFSDTKRSQEKILGGFDLTKINGRESLALSLETNIDEFLGKIVDTMTKHRNVIYRISKQYLEDAHARYNYAIEAAKKINIDKFQENPKLLHPTQKSEGNGQYLSLFSRHLKDGESGYSNLIAYIKHCHNGLVNRNFPGGNNHLYRHTRNQYELREHFGISSLSAVAASNIIIIESGINVESLRHLRLSKQNELSTIFEPTKFGYQIKYHKPRARKFIKRNLKYSNEENYIEKAFNYLAEVTDHHRTVATEDIRQKLFLYQTNTELIKIRPMSDLPFKQGFKKLLTWAKELIQDDPDWCKGVTQELIDDVLKHRPNAKKLRATEGIIRWYKSGGNPAVAAKYLGNSEAIAIKNYLPKELQLAVYNQKIRRFQNVLIASATNGSDYQISAIDLKDKIELSEYIKRIKKRIPNWGAFINTMSKPMFSPPLKIITFDICAENIAIMRACYEIEKSETNNNKEISEISSIYTSLLHSLQKKPDHKLQRIVKKGMILYENKIDSYENIHIFKEN